MGKVYSLFLCAILSVLSFNSVNAQTYAVDTMNGKTYTTCSGVFTDGTGNYANNESYTTTFCSSNGNYLKFDFSASSSALNLDAGTGDTLFFYNGTTATGTPIATLSQSDDIGFTQLQINTLSTCVTIKWKSDASTVDGGWDAVITCGNPPVCSGNTNPPPADIFGQAPLICNLNGYCGSTASYYGEDTPYNLFGGGNCGDPVGAGFDGVFGGTIENNSWLAFQADASTATFNFNVYGGGACLTGIQAAVFEFDAVTNTFILKSPCSLTDGSGLGIGSSTLTAAGLTIGRTYYIMMDGNAGDVCDYTVRANTGVAVVNAGRDSTVCLINNAFNLNASPAGTGTWSVVSGTGTFSNSGLSSTLVRGLSMGINRFEWISNNSCNTSKDTISVTVTGFANADAGTDKQLTCAVTSVTIGTVAVSGNTYAWSPTAGLSSATVAEPTATQSGTYILTVTNTSSGCVATDTVEVLNGGLIATETHSTSTCGSSNGSIDVSVSGGTFPYTYNWNDGAATQDRSGLIAGTYTVIVTDFSGCSTTLSVTIIAVPGTCVSCPATETYTDPGGAANYPNNSSLITTFCSNSGSYLSFAFSGGSNFFDIDVPGDSLIFYDGVTATGTPIAILTYLDDNTQTTYSSQLKIATLSTCVTVRFSSNASGTDAGFSATVACENPPTCSGNPPASDIMMQAPLICNLNGYCGTTSTYYGEDTPWNLIGGGNCPATDDGGIFGGTIENNSWLSFVASATTASFNFAISNYGSGSGLQLAILGFDGTNLSLKSPCATTDGSQTGNTTLSATGLTIGETYYIMIDGAAGSTCDYVVSANTGVITVNAGPDQSLCANTTTLAASSSLGSGVWTLKSGTGTFADASNPTTTVNGLSPGQNVFLWTSTNTSCSSNSTLSYDSVIINISCVLPVELMNFDYRCQENFTELFWQTASESNNDYFIIERANEDLVFEPVGTVKGAGNSNTLQSYVFRDYNRNSANYYQLVQVDKDGTKTNSKLIAAKNTCTVDHSINTIFYNADNNEIVIKYKSSESLPVTISLSDVFGWNIFTEKSVFDQGNNEWRFGVGTLENAIYICSVSGTNFNTVKKIFINKK